MCGIFGFSRATEASRQLMPWLALGMQSRGKDSWGGTDGVDVIKHLGKIEDSWELPKWKRGIFHTRSGTSGAVSLENQHPFKYSRADGSYVIGVHNGVITNHHALDSKHGRSLAVDSMHVYAHIAEDKDLGEIEGWGALAWFDVSPGGRKSTMNFCRFNMDSFHFMLLEDGGIVFASTLDTIKFATKMLGVKYKQLYEYKERVVHYISQDPDTKEDQLYITTTTLPFGERGCWNRFGADRSFCGYGNAQTYNNSGWIRKENGVYVLEDRGTSSDSGASSEAKAGKGSKKFCIKCSHEIVGIKRKKPILCTKCLTDFTTESPKLIVKEPKLHVATANA